MCFERLSCGQYLFPPQMPLNSGIWGKFCLMASLWNGAESAWVFQVPFPLGIINLFISWKAGLCTFVFDVTLQADKYECWKRPKNLGMERSPNHFGKADSNSHDF